jgi:hypothetical protein
MAKFEITNQERIDCLLAMDIASIVLNDSELLARIAVETNTAMFDLGMFYARIEEHLLAERTLGRMRLGGRHPDQREAWKSLGMRGGLDFVWLEEATKYTEDDWNWMTTRARGTAAPRSHDEPR